jgi:hypothetical protein
MPNRHGLASLDTHRPRRSRNGASWHATHRTGVSARPLFAVIGVCRRWPSAPLRCRLTWPQFPLAHGRNQYTRGRVQNSRTDGSGESCRGDRISYRMLKRRRGWIWLNANQFGIEPNRQKAILTLVLRRHNSARCQVIPPLRKLFAAAEAFYNNIAQVVPAPPRIALRRAAGIKIPFDRRLRAVPTEFRWPARPRGGVW